MVDIVAELNKYSNINTENPKSLEIGEARNDAALEALHDDIDTDIKSAF